MEITIYHNPRCRKSREAVQHLEEHNINFEVVGYMEDKLKVSNHALKKATEHNVS